MSSNCDSRYGNPNGSANETEGGSSGCTADKANLRPGLSDMAVELFLKLREAAAHVTEIMGVRTGERIVKTIELEEDIKGLIALGLGK